MNRFVEMFDKGSAEGYDDRNSKFAPISENFHFLSRLVLKNQPPNARVLCVGVGTGADILGLAKSFPDWRFTALEPSSTMLAGCRRRMEKEGLSDRCDFFQGYLSDFRSPEMYDVVFSALVMHFIKDLTIRSEMYRSMAEYLKAGGQLVVSEISYDVESPLFDDILETWKAMHALAGGTKESLDAIGPMVRNGLGVISPEKTERLIRDAGFSNPVRFFQALFISAWFARKV